MDAEVINRVNELASTPVNLGGWLGIKYEEDGCIKFLYKPFHEIGIEMEPTQEGFRKEKWRFKKVTEPRFGDLAVFENLPLERFHVAFMLDRRRAIQSGQSTNGVGKIDVSRSPWRDALRGFYRHKGIDP